MKKSLTLVVVALAMISFASCKKAEVQEPQEGVPTEVVVDTVSPQDSVEVTVNSVELTREE